MPRTPRSAVRQFARARACGLTLLASTSFQDVAHQPLAQPPHRHALCRVPFARAWASASSSHACTLLCWLQLPLCPWGPKHDTRGCGSGRWCPGRRAVAAASATVSCQRGSSAGYLGRRHPYMAVHRVCIGHQWNGLCAPPPPRSWPSIRGRCVNTRGRCAPPALLWHRTRTWPCSNVRTRGPRWPGMGPPAGVSCRRPGDLHIWEAAWGHCAAGSPAGCSVIPTPQARLAAAAPGDPGRSTAAVSLALRPAMIPDILGFHTPTRVCLICMN